MPADHFTSAHRARIRTANDALDRAQKALDRAIARREDPWRVTELRMQLDRARDALLSAEGAR